MLEELVPGSQSRPPQPHHFALGTIGGLSSTRVHQSRKMLPPGCRNPAPRPSSSGSGSGIVSSPLIAGSQSLYMTSALAAASMPDPQLASPWGRLLGFPPDSTARLPSALLACAVQTPGSGPHCRDLLMSRRVDSTAIVINAPHTAHRCAQLGDKIEESKVI